MSKTYLVPITEEQHNAIVDILNHGHGTYNGYYDDLDIAWDFIRLSLAISKGDFALDCREHDGAP